MALVKFSPAISAISGSTASIVFSRWKGRHYIRERVIPANPRSTLQTTQRNYFAKVVGWWHDVKAILKDACDELGATWSVSGFNAFQSRDVKDMADEVDERIMPLNTPVNPIDDLAAATGATAAGDIDLTWAQGEAVTGQIAFVLYEKTATPAGQSAVVIKTTAVAVETEAYTLEGLDPAIEYNVWLIVQRPTNAEVTEMFSIARKATATSKAA